MMSENERTLPSLSDIRKAAKTIHPFAHRTPVLTSRFFNHLTGGDIFFKCENFQRAGAFKFRGAANAIFTLTENEGKRGIITHSSGNHAQAVALAAGLRGYKATIVMPENAPRVKINAVRNYGANIIFCESTIASREQTTQQVIEKTGGVFIHPYNHFDVIAGQGTAAAELMEEVPGLEIIMAPVGGGGLISGTAIAAKSLSPKIKIIACEPERADDAWRSFQSKKPEPVLHSDTIADGLRTSLGDLTLSAILQHVDDVVTVPELSIIREMRNIWERMKIIAEPSSAVPVAALADKKIDIKGKKTGIILTGGNADLNNLPF